MFALFDQITNWIVTAIGNRGPLAIFLGGLIEQVIIPIPSPLITMAGGFLLVPQDISFLNALRQILIEITLPYTIAATLGLGIVYFIAYFGGKPLIEQFKGWLGFSWHNVEQLQKRFRGNWWDEALIVLLRAIPVVPISLVSGVAGAIRFSIPKFYIFSMIGILLRSLILGFVGWQTGEAYQAIAGGFDKVESYVTLALLIAIAGLLLWGYRKREDFLNRD